MADTGHEDDFAITHDEYVEFGKEISKLEPWHGSVVPYSGTDLVIMRLSEQHEYVLGKFDPIHSYSHEDPTDLIARNCIEYVVNGKHEEILGDFDIPSEPEDDGEYGDEGGSTPVEPSRSELDTAAFDEWNQYLMQSGCRGDGGRYMGEEIPHVINGCTPAMFEEFARERKHKFEPVIVTHDSCDPSEYSRIVAPRTYPLSMFPPMKDELHENLADYIWHELVEMEPGSAPDTWKSTKLFDLKLCGYTLCRKETWWLILEQPEGREYVHLYGHGATFGKLDINSKHSLAYIVAGIILGVAE